MIASNDTFLEGTARIIEEFVAANKPPQQHKYLYFGDQYLSDVFLCSQRKDWDAVAIIEELSMLKDEYAKIEAACPLPPLDLKMIPYADHWGDFFRHGPDGTPAKKNFFTLKALQDGRYAVALLRHIIFMLD